MFKVIYLTALLVLFGTRLWYRWRARNNPAVVSHTTLLEAALLVVTFVGMICIPLLFVFTPLLNFASYALPSWAGWR